MIFAEYAATQAVDLERVIRMLLLHDLVEIDAGDTYCYDDQAAVDQHARENLAADRIFGMLPSDQARDFRRLWDEFEDAQTAEARYAHAMDRFQAFLHNYLRRARSGGSTASAGTRSSGACSRWNAAHRSCGNLCVR